MGRYLKRIYQMIPGMSIRIRYFCLRRRTPRGFSLPGTDRPALVFMVSGLQAEPVFPKGCRLVFGQENSKNPIGVSAVP
jgi:hypothetical protein